MLTHTYYAQNNAGIIYLTLIISSGRYDTANVADNAWSGNVFLDTIIILGRFYVKSFHSYNPFNNSLHVP